MPFNRYWILEETDTPSLTGVACFARLPGVVCPTCGPYGGTRCILASAPEDILREINDLRSSGIFNLPLDAWRKRAKQWEARIQKSRGEKLSLRPGDGFLPLEWYVNGPPYSLWYSVIGGAVIRNDVVSALRENQVSGFDFAEISNVYEVDDRMEICESPSIRPAEISATYAFASLHFSHWREGCRLGWLTVCQVCGCERITGLSTETLSNKWAKMLSDGVFPKEMIPVGVDIFSFPRALLVSDRAYECFTNATPCGNEKLARLAAFA